MWKNLLINDVGKGQAKNGGDDDRGHLLFQSFISGPLSGPLFPAFYSSLLSQPSPAEEAQQEDGAAETELDVHGGPDALEAERGG